MKIFLDGRAVDFEGHPTILDVARAGGVYIPSLCDYPGLEPFAACRLCLVEVKGRRGYVPACHTKAEDGLEVGTATPEIQALRRGILELILAEHPHACLICAEKHSCDDYKSTIRKVGEVTGCVLCPANSRCDLQKVVEAVAVERVHFPALRRTGEVRRDDPFIDRDNSLCILCGRCVRVCHEIRGASVLTFVFRGSETVIGAARDRRLLDSGCRFCGACVDACPTASLSDRGLRYERLPEATAPALCPLCAQGCRLCVGLKGGRIHGTVPDLASPVNHGQACVKGRFLVKAAVHHQRRRLRPMVRKEGSLRDASWEEALEAAAGRLAAAGAGRVVVSGSSQGSCEDLFVLHRFAAEVLKAPAVAGSWTGAPSAALRDLAAAAGTGVSLNFRFADVGAAGAIIQFGEDLPETQPILGLEVYRAIRNGALLIKAESVAGRPGGWASLKAKIPDGREEAFVGALLAVMGREPGAAAGLEGLANFKAATKGFDLQAALRSLGVPRTTFVEMARGLMTRRPGFVLFGREFLRTARGRQRLTLLWNLAALIQARLIPLETEANLRGALEIAAAFPAAGEAGGRKAKETGAAGVGVLYLAGPNPCPGPGKRDFVVVQGPYHDDLDEIADVILPETTAFETDGTFVNAEGRAQGAVRAIEPQADARPGWRILADLAAKMGSSAFGYGSAGDVRDALAAAVPAFHGLSALPGQPDGVFLEEPEPPRAAFIRAKRISGARTAASGGPAPGNPDEYRGLDLARENKSLRLVRGR
jgi:NADH dehydrogenase/NADH:ubiquinone oxidoreductase subunit G